ncbi:Uncharacterised protein [Bacillus freudenreichii]|nr:Uncharacterised protein [Bacillus freudenreichii]
MSNFGGQETLVQAKPQDKESFVSVTSHEEKALLFRGCCGLRRRRAGRASATEVPGWRDLRRPGPIGLRSQAARSKIRDVSHNANEISCFAVMA